jgi:hypothetical protein
VRVTVACWSAWAPGLETAAAWEAWAKAPHALPHEGAAEAKFLPAMLRRRCTPLTRAMLTAAYGCVDASELGSVRTVFGSRHGSINESIGLLEAVVRREKLSPAVFSHTVHNAQAGLFSIAAGNREASSSLSARGDSFACSWIEALTFLEREPAKPVLLVVGDVPLAETFAPLVDEPSAPYALACLLRPAAPGEPGVALSLAEQEQPQPQSPWPAALSFLRWWLGDEASLALGEAGTRYAFRRGSG